MGRFPLPSLCGTAAPAARAVRSVYRGEWRAGLIHGCGVRLRRGQQQAEFDVQEGKFLADDFCGPVMACRLVVGGDCVGGWPGVVQVSERERASGESLGGWAGICRWVGRSCVGG